MRIGQCLLSAKKRTSNVENKRTPKRLFEPPSTSARRKRQSYSCESDSEFMGCLGSVKTAIFQAGIKKLWKINGSSH